MALAPRWTGLPDSQLGDRIHGLDGNCRPSSVGRLWRHCGRGDIRCARSQRALTHHRRGILRGADSRIEHLRASNFRRRQPGLTRSQAGSTFGRGAPPDARRVIEEEEVVPISRDCPLARAEGLIIEELGGELLVYDSESNMAHALHAEAAAVWRACDGRTDTQTLAGCCHTTEEKVRDALARLGELGLLEATQHDQEGTTRRAALRKITIAGVGVASASTISSILVPTAAAQGSCVQPGECLSPGQTCCAGHPTGLTFSDCPNQEGCCLPAGTCIPFMGLAHGRCCNGYTFDPSCREGASCT